MWGTPQEPQSGDRFREMEAWNKRLIIRPVEYIPDIKKLDTRGDAIKLNVVDLDDASGTPRLYREILWFSGPLIGVLKGSLGTPFLGYITKEKNPSGYMAWKFYDLSADPDTDARAQAWLAVNPDFLAPLAVRDTFGGPMGQGPAPEWAVAPVPQAPPGPPAMAPRPPAPPVGPPAQPGYSAPPAPPGVPQPPAPPVSAPPASPVADPQGVMERLRRQAGINPSADNVGVSAQEAGF